MEKFPTYSPEKIQFPDISRELERMAQKDQEIRSVDTGNDIEKDHEVAEKMKEINIENAERMKEVIEQIGWPTASKVGKKQSSNAWLLVQHADHDIEFQKLCLNLMKESSKEDVDVADIAYLEDRIRVNSKEGQVYGTQFKETKDESNQVIAYEPKPIEDEKHVNERRASVGLEPLEEYKEHLTRKYHPHLLEKK